MFVVPGGDPAPLLEAQVPALYGVAFGVDRLVESRWAAAFSAHGFAAVLLVLPFRDCVRDPSAAQLFSGRRMRVGLVRQQPETRLPVHRILLPVQVQQRLQLWIVTGLTRGQDDRDRAGAVVGQCVDFRAQAASGPTDRMV